ncbi:helix-turn-helix transcriptional regulator [Allokutzneria sp. A3M-2-11 16]|uniref:helix-turn-helix domain-containing protein n=1 Tax=Allokutzneria sp. A3M-2-11 16 TaxID=2962043 RepID=UPI0020B6A4F0|nr:helix-turn-helix transcriptional regulator [Allokutzneria sp. A3M-2-11 16]MCP3805410.1 helix-turn-helix transcriptional regulator [Allokutzneria sp. A3M-2-11 16]
MIVNDTAIHLCPQGKRRHGIGRLSARELELLPLVARGLNNEQIAEAMGLAVPTVKSYLASINQVVRARNRAHLTAIAYVAGVLETPDAAAAEAMIDTVTKLRSALCEIAQLCGQSTAAWPLALALPQLVDQVTTVVRRYVEVCPAPVSTILAGAEAEKASDVFDTVVAALAEVGAPARLRRHILGAVLDATGIPPGVAAPHAEDPVVASVVNDRLAPLLAATEGFTGGVHGNG